MSGKSDAAFGICKTLQGFWEPEHIHSQTGPGLGSRLSVKLSKEKDN